MLRKTFLGLAVLALAAAVPATGPAQAASEGYWGLQGGLVIANMGGDMERVGEELAVELENLVGGDWSSSKGARTSFAAGLTYTRMFQPTVGLQIEGLYANRGVKFDLTSAGQSVETTLKWSYIEVPVMLRWAPSPEAKTQPIVMVGPVVGFKVSSKVKASGDGGDAEGDLEGVESTVFGLNAAAGLRFGVGETTALLVQARYYLGLTSAIDDPQYESKHGDFMIMAGLEFPLGK